MIDENIIYNISEKGAKLLVYELTETVDILLDNMNLSDDEKEQFEKIASEKRRLEYLGIRMCFQKLLGRKVEIKNEDEGKPYLIDNSFEISISHSKKWLAVIAHPMQKVGIDIEGRTDKINKIYKRFLSDTEQKELSNGENQSQLELAWSAKEALYKIIGNSAVDFSNHLRIFPFETKTEGRISAEHLETGTKYKLSYIQTDKFSLVYCIS